MQTRITARHFDVSDGLRANIENTVGKLGRYYDGIQEAHIVLDGHESRVEGKSAEITVTVKRQLLKAQQVSTTHQDAVRGCVRQLRRQVVRYKDRLRDVKQDRHR